MDFMSFFKKTAATQVLEHLPDGLILTDMSGKILHANKYAKELLGLKEKTNIADALEINIKMIENLAEKEMQSVFKVPGEEFSLYVELSASKIENENKFIITVRNVTQTHEFMKKMLVETESSKKVNRDKNSFLVKMSNELKSPLHSIDGFSKALLEGLGGEINEKQEKYLNIINKNAYELLFLLGKIIEQAKIESGLYEWDYKHLDIVSVMQSVLRPYKEVLTEKNIEFTVDIEEVEKRTCFTDENAVKTIIDTLMDTAIKATYLGSINIKLSHPDLDFVATKEIEYPETATEKSFIQFTISDTGSGLTENEQTYIFDPYYQLETGNRKNMPKSIALSIVNSLVKNLKGKIWVESETMQGTSFSFIIPTERLNA